MKLYAHILLVISLFVQNSLAKSNNIRKIAQSAPPTQDFTHQATTNCRIFVTYYLHTGQEYENSFDFNTKSKKDCQQTSKLFTNIDDRTRVKSKKVSLLWFYDLKTK